MNDELHENSRELELELREELDLMRSKLTGAERRTQAAQDNANDHIVSWLLLLRHLLYVWWLFNGDQIARKF